VKLTKIVYPVILIGTSLAEVNYSLNLNLASQYVLEGRAATENPFISASLEATVQDFNFSIFSGTAINEEYIETIFYVGYGKELNNGLSFGFGFGHLEFGHDGTNDDELDASVSYNLGYGWEASVSWLYSFEADGSYVDIGVVKSIDLGHGVTLSPYALLAYDFGYSTEDFDGVNHFQFGAEVTYDIFSFAAHQVIALEDVERDGGGDEFFVNTGVTWEF